MENVGVLMTCPMSTYLEQELEKRFKLFKLWESPFVTRRADSVQAVVGNTKIGADSVQAVVGNTKIGADSELIDSLSRLEIIASYSVGLDKIDLDKCRERGIRVTNTPNVLTEDVADVAVGLTLAVLRKISTADRFVKSGMWRNGDFDLGTKFSGKSIGIVGLGRIGSAIAKRVSAFNCTVSYHSRTKKPNTTHTYYSNILDLAANSQILVIACSLTDQTRHIVNRDVIDALGPKGILVNIGRGPHFDQNELVSALLEGRLCGAGLDVFENEPDVTDSLFGLENVVLLPRNDTHTFKTTSQTTHMH